MGKDKHVVKLRGIISTSTGIVVAKTHQAADVEEFHGDSPKTKSYFKVSGYKDAEGNYEVLFVETPKGRYEMTFNEGAGIWQHETASGVKFHVSLKKVVGELRYWA